MARAVKCPACGGSGKIYLPAGEWTTAGPTYVTCNSCGGRGWVEVSE